MKTQIKTVFTLALGLVAASPAFASYYQIDCGTADGSTRMNNGHNDNGVYLTQRVYGQGGERGYRDTIVTRETNDLKVEVLDSKPLFASSQDGCRPGQEMGFGGKKEIDYKLVRISNADGSAFDKHTLGASPDGLSVEAHLICEGDWSWQMQCPK